jgi:hypothetical protein
MRSTMKHCFLIISAVVAFSLMAGRVLAAQPSPPPEVPYNPIIYPGADFASIECKPGANQSENGEVDRRATAFVTDVASGSLNPRYLERVFPRFALPSLQRTFAQLGSIRSLRFHDAHVACAVATSRLREHQRVSVSYYYQIIGSDASMWMQIIFRDGMVEEFHQGPRPTTSP